MSHLAHMVAIDRVIRPRSEKAGTDDQNAHSYRSALAGTIGTRETQSPPGRATMDLIWRLREAWGRE